MAFIASVDSIMICSFMLNNLLLLILSVWYSDLASSVHIIWSVLSSMLSVAENFFGVSEIYKKDEN